VYLLHFLARSIMNSTQHSVITNGVLKLPDTITALYSGGICFDVRGTLPPNDDQEWVQQNVSKVSVPKLCSHFAELVCLGVSVYCRPDIVDRFKLILV
jgi:hypothetical protein